MPVSPYFLLNRADASDLQSNKIRSPPTRENLRQKMRGEPSGKINPVTKKAE